MAAAALSGAARRAAALWLLLSLLNSRDHAAAGGEPEAWRREPDRHLPVLLRQLLAERDGGGASGSHYVWDAAEWTVAATESHETVDRRTKLLSSFQGSLSMSSSSSSAGSTATSSASGSSSVAVPHGSASTEESDAAFAQHESMSYNSNGFNDLFSPAADDAADDDNDDDDGKGVNGDDNAADDSPQHHFVPAPSAFTGTGIGDAPSTTESSPSSGGNSSPVSAPSPTRHGNAPSPASGPTVASPTEGTTDTASAPAAAPSALAWFPTASAPGSLTHGERIRTSQAKCGMTLAERSDALLAALSAASDSAGSRIQDRSSTQHQAFAWLDESDDALLCAEDARLPQRYALAVAYFALDGGAWTQCRAGPADGTEAGPCPTGSARWLSATSECTWYGVSCDDQNRVQVLTLKDNNLAGNLPEELFQLLPWLSGLSLDHNKNIKGTIPSSMNFANLTYIELDDNALTGPFPDAFYALPSLKAIDLDSNHLTGTISDRIGELTKLMVLQIEDNRLDGPIPSSGLTKLSSMLLLTLHGNQFTGSLDAVCAQVPGIRVTYPGYLQFLSADCDPVACPCCSACF